MKAKKTLQEPKRKAGRPRKAAKSIEQFVDEIDIDRMTELEQEVFYRNADQHEVEQYVRGSRTSYKRDDDEDSFSYWFGQN